jgi:hypothetical protein
MLGLVRDGRDARRGLVGIACRRKNFRPDPLPRSVEAVVRALQQRAERQIAAADNDRIEDLFVVPAALQAGEASCGTRQQPARLRQGEREMIHAGPIAKAQREIGRPVIATARNATLRRHGHCPNPVCPHRRICGVGLPHMCRGNEKHRHGFDVYRHQRLVRFRCASRAAPVTGRR